MVLAANSERGQGGCSFCCLPPMICRWLSAEAHRLLNTNRFTVMFVKLRTEAPGEAVASTKPEWLLKQKSILMNTARCYGGFVVSLFL